MHHPQILVISDYFQAKNFYGLTSKFRLALPKEATCNLIRLPHLFGPFGLWRQLSLSPGLFSTFFPFQECLKLFTLSRPFFFGDLGPLASSFPPCQTWIWRKGKCV